MRRFADSLLRDDEDVHLLLVPHVTMAGQYDDHPLCLSLAERLSAPERVSVLSRTLDACQMKHAIGECDCFIGARTHSTIASLSLLVPTLSIAYSTKAYGLNRDLFGHERYVVHVREASPERLMNAYRQLRREQDEVRSRLHRAIPLACERARHGARLLRTLCQ
jgi:polysaccharide pyruvyl transferase WcaK-like protein